MPKKQEEKQTNESEKAIDFRIIGGGKVSDDGLRYEFPPVYSTNVRTKKDMSWQIVVSVCVRVDTLDTKLTSEDQVAIVPIQDKWFDSKPMPNNHYSMIKVLSKYESSEKYASKKPTFVTTGLNAGKANATNVFTQALRDAQGKHNKQKKNSADHVVGLDSANQKPRYPPMLVKKKTASEVIDYTNSYLQYKYNGVRTITTLEKENVLMYSRKQTEYDGFDHIKQELLQPLATAPPDLYLDGELYKHGVALQDISGLARKSKKSDIAGELIKITDDNTTNIDSLINKTIIEYYVYDCFLSSQPELSYTERKKILDDFFARNKFQYVKQAPTVQVTSEQQVIDLYKQYLAEGYEGAILRKGACTYQYGYNNYHSSHLLKIKPDEDGEFEIVDYKSGKKGKASNELMFVLQTTDGKQFTVTLGLTAGERTRLYAEMPKIEDNGKTVFENKYKGKFLTVKYAQLSKDNVPQQATTNGLLIRDYE